MTERTSKGGAGEKRGGQPAARQGSLFQDPLRSFQTPRPSEGRIGIVDVGSNSVRMVVFEDGRRCPAMVFNEKVLCGLGADLSATGRLSPDGVERALRAMRRFVALSDGLEIRSLAGIATAAVREAEDGPEFCERVLKETGIRLEVASGQREARLAAQGVLFGDPAARGLVIDLGGASMELCPVRAGQPGRGVTTPLGPQLLGDLTNREAVRARIAAALGPYVSRYTAAGRRLYLVGGAWRALGRVQIEQSGHPMSVLHEYSFDAAAARAVASHVLASSSEELASVPAMPSGRVDNLPAAAILLDALVGIFEPDEIVLSGFGLREGLCYDFLPDGVRTLDPLLSTCAGQEQTRARAPGFGRELSRWILGAIHVETPEERRLIRAACHLSDVSWRAHPDYRAKSCIEVVTRANVSGAGHRGRAFMAACLLNRYKGGRKAMADEPAMTLLTEEEKDRATAIGALMRLGATIAGATPGYLGNCSVRLEDGVLRMTASPRSRVYLGEEVEKRLMQAARALDAEAVLEN